MFRSVLPPCLKPDFGSRAFGYNRATWITVYQEDYAARRIRSMGHPLFDCSLSIFLPALPTSLAILSWTLSLRSRPLVPLPVVGLARIPTINASVIQPGTIEPACQQISAGTSRNHVFRRRSSGNSIKYRQHTGGSVRALPRSLSCTYWYDGMTTAESHPFRA